MQAVRRGAIGKLEFPSRKAALDNLDGMGDPIDRLEQSLDARAARRRLKCEADLRLDARVDEAFQRNNGSIAQRTGERAIVDGAPDRLADPKAGPDGGVCEAGLAPHPQPAPLPAGAVGG